MQNESVIAIFVAVLALLGTIITALVSAKKNEVEALRGIIAELRDQVDELRCENKDLKNWAERLVNQVKVAGLTPVEFFRTMYGKDQD